MRKLLLWLLLVQLSCFRAELTDDSSLIYFNDSSYELRHRIEPPTPIEPSCLSYYSYLAKLGSLFTQCVVNYSRPFRVCDNCLKYYMEIIDAKKLIQNVRRDLVFFNFKYSNNKIKLNLQGC